MKRRLSLGAAWLLTAVAMTLGPAAYFGEMVEGIDPAYTPIWPSVIATFLLVSTLAASILWRSEATEPPSGRRRFLTVSGTLLGGVAAAAAVIGWRLRGWWTVTGAALKADGQKTHPNPPADWSGSRVVRYRPLGSTGFEVSDISLGSGRINLENDGEAIAREAIARGINYFDTAPDYSGNGSELALGRAMKGHRDRMFLATKFCTGQGHIQAGAPVGDYIRAIEGSLQRLQTDYVDLVHIHSCDSVERLLDPNVHEAFDRLKEQGKVRFLGVSTHTPKLETVATAAIESKRFDVMMLAYHFGSWPLLTSIIDRAHDSGMGIVAMKTLKGAKHHGLAGFRQERDAYSQAAFKWVLSNPKVACLVVSFFEHQHVDEYLQASGKAPADQDVALLDRYDELTRGRNCLPHCGQCLDSCPENLAIHDVLRHRMYFEDYGWQDEARRLYSQLTPQADACLGCAAPCEAKCPVEIPIRLRTIGTHRMLT